tara:strand:- start:1472 stop:2944 length:1473 start_codon:yes stop_codon:yes gene_type:complete
MKKTVKKIKKTVKKKTDKKPVYIFDRLEQAKKMLDSNLITQKQFDEIKHAIENEKCNTQKKKECKSKNKVCNPNSGRCKKPEEPKKTRIYKPTSPSYSPTGPVNEITIPPNKKIPTRSKILSSIKEMSSYSPEVNKSLSSLKSANIDDLNHKLQDLYSCEKKIDVKINGGCSDYKNEYARKEMLTLLNLKSSTIEPNNVMGPRQSLSNCWLNSFFMCYFISDKGRKFFRKFRKMMITGEIDGSTKIKETYRKGLWLLNKTILASLYAENTERTSNFIRHVDTNDILRLLKEGDKGGVLPKTRQPFNPKSFYDNLFSILGLKDGVKIFNLTHKKDYNEIFPKYNPKKAIPKSFKSIKNAELIIISRRDDPGKNGIDSSKDPPDESFIYGNKKYLLDSVVLRDIGKKHFTSYVTIGGKEYSFDGGAFRKLRPFNWKKKLINGRDIQWGFGSPLKQNDPSKKKEGYVLNEKFNFKKGYQLLFYYKDTASGHII